MKKIFYMAFLLTSCSGDNIFFPEKGGPDAFQIIQNNALKSVPDETHILPPPQKKTKRNFDSSFKTAQELLNIKTEQNITPTSEIPQGESLPNKNKFTDFDREMQEIYQQETKQTRTPLDYILGRDAKPSDPIIQQKKEKKILGLF